MSDDMPCFGSQSRRPTRPTSDPADDEPGNADADDTADAKESEHHKNSRPYGFSNLLVGLLAAAINALLVVVLIVQTRAVRDQLELSREALESSNASFDGAIAQMKEQREAMNDQVASVMALTHTLERVFRDQQRARLSFRVTLEEIDDVQSGVRIVCPIEIGGTTEARQVHFKNYVSSGTAGQRQFLNSLGLDWNQRESHALTAIAPTEVGRQFVTPVLSRTRMSTVLSGRESLYFVGRIEYCDVHGACHYFMRCAEFGKQPGIVSYCGTRLGELSEGP